MEWKWDKIDSQKMIFQKRIKGVLIKLYPESYFQIVSPAKLSQKVHDWRIIMSHKNTIIYEITVRGSRKEVEETYISDLLNVLDKSGKGCRW